MARKNPTSYLTRAALQSRIDELEAENEDLQERLDEILDLADYEEEEEEEDEDEDESDEDGCGLDPKVLAAQIREELESPGDDDEDDEAA